MPFASIRHRVTNYEVWRAYFDLDIRRRRGEGVLSHRVYRALDDAGDVQVVLEIESREKLRELLDDPDRAALMAKAGVVSDPEVMYWEDCGGLNLRDLPPVRPAGRTRATKRGPAPRKTTPRPVRAAVRPGRAPARPKRNPTAARRAKVKKR